MRTIRWIMLFTVCSTMTLNVTGCAEFYGSTGSRQSRYRSSVVDYLYPIKDVQEVPSIPHLSLPLRLGVAFVPESGGINSSQLPEKEKMDLMDRISAEFRKLPFIKEIEIIPSAYLMSGGGFRNLDQIKTMYGVDIMALLSYDQVQHTDQGLLSVAYWTIVGAYIFQGEKNDTSTMMDAAVYDIASRKMLFRAPGLSHVKGSATPVNLTEQLRADSSSGFRLALDDLVVNLQTQLDLFQAKVKEKPQEYVVEHNPGYTGGGSIGGTLALALLALGGLTMWLTTTPSDAKPNVIAVYFACMSVVVYLWPDLAGLLIYDRQAILAGDFWRLATACFVHFSPSHLFWDILIFTAAGILIKVRDYPGFGVLCCLAALTPTIFLLLASPDIIRFGGSSGLATGGVAYLCLCEISRTRRYRSLWLSILVLLVVKIAVENSFHVPIFAGSSGVSFQVLPSVHAYGCVVALAVYGAIRLNKRICSRPRTSAAEAGR